MSIVKVLLFSLFLSFQLTGCVLPIPNFSNNYNEIDEVQPKLEHLIKISASSFDVFNMIGKTPFYHFKNKIDYKLCKSPALAGWYFGIPNTSGGDAGFPIKEYSAECSKLVLIFDHKDQLKEYSIKDRENEDESLSKLSHLHALAQSGNSESQWEYFYRRPILESSFKWLCMAADQNHADAQRRVAFIYRTGNYGTNEKKSS